MATSGWSRPYARSLIASARSSMSRCFARSPNWPRYAFPRFVSVISHFRMVAAVRPLVNRGARAPACRASSRSRLDTPYAFPRLFSVMATCAWSRPYEPLVDRERALPHLHALGVVA